MLLRRENLEPPMSLVGQKRRIDVPDDFAACPLCLR
jgi:hypothetical protein